MRGQQGGKAMGRWSRDGMAAYLRVAFHFGAFWSAPESGSMCRKLTRQRAERPSGVGCSNTQPATRETRAWRDRSCSSTRSTSISCTRANCSSSTWRCTRAWATAAWAVPRLQARPGEADLAPQILLLEDAQQVLHPHARGSPPTNPAATICWYWRRWFLHVGLLGAGFLQLALRSLLRVACACCQPGRGNGARPTAPAWPPTGPPRRPPRSRRQAAPAERPQARGASRRASPTAVVGKCPGTSARCWRRHRWWRSGPGQCGGAFQAHRVDLHLPLGPGSHRLAQRLEQRLTLARQQPASGGSRTAIPPAGPRWPVPRA